MYIEAYGNKQGGFTFIALRFIKPIVRMYIREDVEPIQTDNILVIYSNKPVHTSFDTLTFVVKAPCSTNAVRVESGLECNLLLAMLNDSNVYTYSFHDSVLYVVGTKNLYFKHDTLPKTITFRALYTLTKNGLENTLGLEHFKHCKYFKRNHLVWKKWQSWWNLLLKIINICDFVSTPITLQLGEQISRIYNNSQQNFTMEEIDLYKCEIDMCEKSFLGIIYKMENNMVMYVSPMIISKSNANKTFNDVNQIICNHWLPLYFNKHVWLNQGIYYYILNLKKNTLHLKKVLGYLEGTTVEKFSFIEKDLKTVYKILTGKNIKI